MHSRYFLTPDSGGEDFLFAFVGALKMTQGIQSAGVGLEKRIFSLDSVFYQFLKLFQLYLHNYVVDIFILLNLDLEVVHVVRNRLLLEKLPKKVLAELGCGCWCL